MIEYVKHIEWANLIPFMLATGASQPRINLSRMIETLIIGGIAAGATVWSTQSVIQNEISNIKKEVIILSVDIRELRETSVATGLKLVAMEVKQSERYGGFMARQTEKDGQE